MYSVYSTSTIPVLDLDLHVDVQQGVPGNSAACRVPVAALFRKTDWESGRGVLPCWKAESAPRATTKPLFSAEACSAYQYSRSA